MAHGFQCLVCGHVETAHGWPEYRTCGQYTSPAPEEERLLWKQDIEAEARQRRASLQLVKRDG